jgi:hypothetical protein
MLWHQLKPTIWTRCWGLLSRVTHCCTVMPIHTPLLAYANRTSSWSILHIVVIWPFQTVTSLVHSKTLWDAAILPEAVHVWLVTQPKTFFSVGIWKFVDCWPKFVEKDGDCTEKWCYCTLILIVLFNKKLIANVLWLILLIQSLQMFVQLDQLQ